MVYFFSLSAVVFSVCALLNMYVLSFFGGGIAVAGPSLRPLLIDRIARKVERRKSREFSASQNLPYSGGKGENFKCLIFN